MSSSWMLCLRHNRRGNATTRSMQKKNAHKYVSTCKLSLSSNAEEMINTSFRQKMHLEKSLKKNGYNNIDIRKATKMKTPLETTTEPRRGWRVYYTQREPQKKQIEFEETQLTSTLKTATSIQLYLLTANDKIAKKHTEGIYKIYQCWKCYLRQKGKAIDTRIKEHERDAILTEGAGGRRHVGYRAKMDLVEVLSIATEEDSSRKPQRQKRIKPSTVKNGITSTTLRRTYYEKPSSQWNRNCTVRCTKSVYNNNVGP